MPSELPKLWIIREWACDCGCGGDVREEREATGAEVLRAASKLLLADARDKWGHPVGTFEGNAVQVCRDLAARLEAKGGAQAMKRIKQALITAAIVAAASITLAGGCWLATAGYRECHRVHPWWYCAVSR